MLIGYARTSTSNQKYSLEDQIDEIYFKTIKNTALMLREFDHFDSYEFDAEGY